MDLMREYDNGIVTRFQPATVQVTVAGVAAPVPVLQVTVPGIVAPVPLGVGMPEEWFTPFGMPYISVTRGAPLPAMNRAQPSWQGQLPVVGDPTKVQLLKVPPQAANIPYAIELVAGTMSDLNALVNYVLTAAMPLMGFGTTVTVAGEVFGYRCTGSRDKTNYASTQGRVFRYAFFYTVEGWIFSLDADVVGVVQSIDATYVVVKDGVDVNASLPPDVSQVEATDVREIPATP